MRTAKSWGLTPDEWARVSPDGQARMIAHDILSSAAEGYEMKQREAAGKDGKGKPGGTSSPPDGGVFERMKSRARSREQGS
jgi:hypothetical protein